MKISLEPTFVVVSDDKPGNHATLFVNGNKAKFRGDLSTFKDAHRLYAWVFEATARNGTEIVFATADREYGGVVQNDKFEPRSFRVTRVGEKPMAVSR